MYTGALRAASNRARWTFSVELTDEDTGAAVDLTGATIEVAVRDQQSKQPLLTGSTTDGRVTLTSPTAGIFSILFTRDIFGVLAAGMYDVGVRVILASGSDFQLIVATLPVVDGVLDQ